MQTLLSRNHHHGERLLAELLRVVHHFVIMIIIDSHSPKKYLRKARRLVAEFPRQHGAAESAK
jgi:hypothetical protein